MTPEDRWDDNDGNPDDDTDRYTRATPPPLPVRPATKSFRTASRRMAPPLPAKRNSSSKLSVVTETEAVKMDTIAIENIKKLLISILAGIDSIILASPYGNEHQTDEIMSQNGNSAALDRLTNYTVFINDEIEGPTLSLSQVEKLRNQVRTTCSVVMTAVFQNPQDIEIALLSLNAPEVKTINALRKAENCIGLSYGVTTSDNPQQKALKLAAALFCFVIFKKEDAGEDFWERADHILNRIAQTAFEASSFSRLRELLGLVMTRKWSPTCFDSSEIEIPSSRIKIPSIVRIALERLKTEILFGQNLSRRPSASLNDEVKSTLEEHFENIYRMMSGIFVSCHDLIAMHNSVDGLPMEVSSINQEEWQQDTFERIAHEFKKIDTLLDPSSE
jgi:hypothetical protein